MLIFVCIYVDVLNPIFLGGFFLFLFEDVTFCFRYLSWDDYFMAIAFLSAERSKDPNRQVIFSALV